MDLADPAVRAFIKEILTGVAWYSLTIITLYGFYRLAKDD